MLTVSIGKRSLQPARAVLLRILRGSTFSMRHGCDEAFGGGGNAAAAVAAHCLAYVHRYLAHVHHCTTNS